MNIPVFHDDQHGTAIISGAALLNALDVAGKKIEEVKIVFSGAGAAAIACAAPLPASSGRGGRTSSSATATGVIYKGRTEDMDPYKEEFAADTPARTLAEALVGADVFIGLSVGGVVTPEMVRAMARDPIVFAMANPDPEIGYEDARAARAGRHHGHRPQRLSEPGQQRPRLPLHLPRRARRAGHRHQRRDEARRGQGAGRAGPRGRARLACCAPTASSRSASAAST